MAKELSVILKETDNTTGSSEIPPRIRTSKHLLQVFLSRKLVLVGLIGILILIITAIFAPYLAPHDPYKQDMEQSLFQPNREHLLGTDVLGRDTLSRVIYGARPAIMVGAVAIGIAASIGMTLGLVAGYFGGLPYMFIMRLIDALMSFPMILFALVVAAILGGGLKNVMIALGIALVSPYCRLMCGQVLSVKQNDYILAARSIGSSHLRLMVRHILPNCFPPLIVMITLQMGTAILAEAGLSFLGIGVQPPGAAWGSMITDGYRYLLTNPILSIAPGLCVMVVVFSFNLVGDGLRDALDPRLRGTL